MSEIINKRKVDIKNNQTFDAEIRRRIQGVEIEIPPSLEMAYLQELEALVPLVLPTRGHRFRNYTILVAATILLAVLTFFSLWYHPTEPGVQSDEVMVQEARIEGEDASAYVINTLDKNITIVWVQKSNNSISATL